MRGGKYLYPVFQGTGKANRLSFGGYFQLLSHLLKPYRKGFAMSQNTSDKQDYIPLFPPKTRRRSRNADGSPNAVDVYVGQRLRGIRMLRGYNQKALAKKLGMTFQQIQKYECGQNRITMSRLWDICCVLGIEPDFFFQGIEEKTFSQSPRMLSNPKANEPFIPPEVEDTDPFLLEGILNLRKIVISANNETLDNLIQLLTWLRSQKVS